MVIFAHSKTDFGSLPKGAKEVRNKGGNTIPMVFVTTADGEKGIEAIPYATLKGDMRKSIRELRKTLEEVDVVGGAVDSDAGIDEDTETNTDADGDVPEFTEWENESLAEVQLVEPVVRFCGIISRHADAHQWAIDLISAQWGSPVLQSPPIPFEAGGYYRASMGDELLKTLVAFEGFHDPGGLADWKLATNQ